MNPVVPSDEPQAPQPKPSTAEALQHAYQARRRAWADAVGRPYDDAADPRPPPGEIDVGPDE